MSVDLAPRLERNLGPAHWATLQNAAHLGRLLDYMGYYQDAVAVLEDASRRGLAAHGGDDPVALTLQGNLAISYMNAGRLDDARKVYDRLLPMIEKRYGERDRRTVLARAHWAELLVRSGHPLEAEQVACENLEHRLFAWQLDRGRDIAFSWSTLGVARMALAAGGTDEALRGSGQAAGLMNLRKALDCALAHNPPDHFEAATHLLRLAHTLTAQNQTSARQEAVELTQRALSIIAAKFGEDAPVARRVQQDLKQLTVK
jgi:tetratricopeptide (TPR) repeat protein